MNCHYYLFPYDFEIIKFDLISLFLKILSSIIYNYHYISNCNISNNNNNENIKYFLIFFLIIVIIIMLIFHLKNYKKFINLNYDYNFYRIGLIFILNLFILIKSIEYFLNIYSIIYNYILFITFFLAGLLIIYTFIYYLNNYNFDSLYLHNNKLNLNTIYECIKMAEDYLKILNNKSDLKESKLKLFRNKFFNKYFSHHQIK